MNSCGSTPDLDPLQADEHADAVVDVDDEIADLQIAEVGEERARWPTGGARDAAALLRRHRSRPRAAAPASGSRKPRERWPSRRAPPVAVGVFGALDRHREDVVVGEQLDGPLGAARRVRDEDDGLAALAAAADLADPVLNAAAELHRRLTGHVAA